MARQITYDRVKLTYIEARPTGDGAYFVSGHIELLDGSGQAQGMPFSGLGDISPEQQLALRQMLDGIIQGHAANALGIERESTVRQDDGSFLDASG